MAKTRRDRSVSFDGSRLSPLPFSSIDTKQSSTSSSLESWETLKEWEDARCPVCMEHPHNAVLLICSSYGKGCRTYMCDTSYRHSNCFDQFCKSFAETPSAPSQEAILNPAEPTSMITTEALLVDGSQEERNEDPISNNSLPNMRKLHQKLLCPLCRGQIVGCTVVESARTFMNGKTRSCACETCDFGGNYTDLRKHARLEHPLVRPSETDPERQRNWRRLERQRDIGDVLSTIQSSFGEDRDEDTILPLEESSWLTVFFLIRVFRPGSSSRSSSWSGISRGEAQTGIRRRRSARLWGESYDEETASASRDTDQLETIDVHSQRNRRRRAVENDEEEAGGASRDVDRDSSGGGSGTRSRRVRRRTTRNDEQ